MQTIRKISSLKPTRKLGFFDKLEACKQPLAFKRSKYSKTLSSTQKCVTASKNVDEKSRLDAGKKNDYSNNIGLEESEKSANSPVSHNIGKSGNFKPKHITVRHIPTNTQIEKNIENIGKGAEPSKVAALVSTNATTDDGLVGDVNTAQISAIKAFDNKNNDKERLHAMECECSINNQSDPKETTDGNEVFSFQLPNDVSPNLEKTPISSMKVDFQMVLPNVEKVMEDYVNLMGSPQCFDNNLDTGNSKSKQRLTFNFNSEGAEIGNFTDKFTPSGIIPLDFKAEISGFLGLSMGHVDEKILREVKNVDFKSLITAITGNLASIAIQKSYEHMEQRNFSTSTDNSSSDISQTYKTNIKKTSEVQKTEKSNNINNVTDKPALVQSTQNIESKEKGELEENAISSKLKNEGFPVILSEGYVFRENLHIPEDYASVIRPTSTNISGGSESPMTQNPKEHELQAEEYMRTNSELSTIMQTRSNFIWEENKYSKDTEGEMTNKSSIDCNENKGKDSDTKNKGPKTDCLEKTDSSCAVLFKKDYFPLQIEEIRKGLRNYAIDSTVLSGFCQASKSGKDSSVKKTECKTNNKKSKSDSSTKSKESKSSVCGSKNPAFKIDPCSPFTSKRDSACALVKKKNTCSSEKKAKKDPKQEICSTKAVKGDQKSSSKTDCSSICGKKANSGKSDKKPESKTDCSSSGGKKTAEKKSGTKIDCSSGKKDAKQSSSKTDCSSICGKKANSGKSDKKPESKTDCSSSGGKKTAEKKSGTKIDCSSGKKDAKQSSSKTKSSDMCGKKKDSGKKDTKSSSKTDCSSICGKKANSGKSDKKPESKIDCSSSGGKKTAEKKSGTKIDCSPGSGKKDAQKSGSKTKSSDMCGKKNDSGKKDKKKLEPRIQCSEKKSDSGICGKKGDKKSKSKIDCSGKKSSSSFGKKSESKTDCSAICGNKSNSPGGKKSNPPGCKKSQSKIDCSADEKKSKPKIDCSSSGGKKSKSKIDCSASKKDDSKSKSKIDCSAGGKKSSSSCGKKSESKIDCSAVCGKKSNSPGGKKSESKIDCSALSGKKDEKKSKPKIDCSSSCGKKSESKIDCSALSGKKDEKKSKSKIDCSSLGGKKSKSKIDCSADEKKSKPKIDCSSSGGKKSKSKIDCSAVKKDDSKSKSKIDCSAGGKKSSSSCGKKSESKIDCSAVCGKKSNSPGGKKSESKIDCSALSGKKDEKKSKPKIDCSSSGGKKSESKIDCSALSEKKSKSKIDCSSLGGKKSKSKIDCSAIYGKKDDSKSKSKIDCSAGGKKSSSSCGKKSESKIDCSAVCGNKSNSPGGTKSKSKIDCSALSGKKDEKKSKPKIDCSSSGGKKSESKIDCSALSGKKDEKKSKSKIDCSSLGGKKSKSKIDCSAISGKKDDSKPKSKIDCSAGGKKSESKIDCSAVCGNKSNSPGGTKSKSKIDCSALSGKKDEKKSKPKIDCSSSGGKKSESKIDCSALSGKKDEKKSKPKIDCSSLGKKSKSKIDCSKPKDNKCGKKPDSKTNCSALSGKKSDSPSRRKSESKIESSTICERKDDMKLDEIKSCCQCGMQDCQCGKKVDQCGIQRIKIFLTQGMHIEITTAQIKKENLQIVQDMLINKLNFKSNTDGGGQSGALHCITLNPEEEAGEINIGPISIYIDDPTKLVSPYQAEKKLTGDKRNQNIPPFIGGDVKSFSTDSQQSSEIQTRPSKQNFKMTEPGIVQRKLNTLNLKQSEFITCLNPVGNISLPEERLNSSSSESETTIINKVVKILDCREVCLDSIPVAPIGDYDVLLKVDTVALSGSDLYMYETGAKTENFVSLGHEASGVVEKIGKHVTNLNVGDCVAVEPGVPCGTCDNCKRGRYNICVDTIFNGSLAKYCVHPADFCHKLPDHCNLEEGALVHPLSLGLYACNRANVSVKSNVLIIGACPLGLCCILCAKAMGARHVTIVDTLQKNIEVAQKLGADIPILLNKKMTDKDVIQGILGNMTRIGHPNVAINCSGCTSSLNTAVMCLAPGGVCVLGGCQTESGHLNIMDTLVKEINMVSSFRSCNTFPLAISLLDSIKAKLYHLITHRYFMSEIKNAFETALDEQVSQAVKVVIKCQEE